MTRFVTKRGWRAFHPQEQLRMHPGRSTHNFRAESFARIYVSSADDFEEEILAGLGEGDIECEVTGYGPLWVRFESEGRLWLRSEEIEQRTLGVYGTSFTQVMERGNVSPEMQYMQNLLRQQQLDRRRENAELAKQMEAFQGQIKAMEDGNVGIQSVAGPEIIGGSPPEGGDDVGAGIADADERESLHGEGVDTPAS